MKHPGLTKLNTHTSVAAFAETKQCRDRQWYPDGEGVKRTASACGVT